MLRAARAAAAILGIGGGTYGLMAFSSVSAAERELRAVRAKLEEETAARKDLEAKIGHHESRAGSLSDDHSTLEKALKDTDKRIAGLKRELEQLEAMREKKSLERDQKHQELISARNQVASLQRDFIRRTESFQEAEKAALVAQKALAAKKHEANPLNHPRVKELFTR